MPYSGTGFVPAHRKPSRAVSPWAGANFHRRQSQAFWDDLLTALFTLLGAPALLVILAVMPAKTDGALRRENAVEHEKERGGEYPASR